MKIMYKVMALCIFTTCSIATRAQVLTSTRQNYFNKYSQILPTPVMELDKAFTTSEGAKVKINFADFTFNGIVTSSIKRFDNLYSVVVEAPDLNNTVLTLSKMINPDKTISYTGHILNQKYADGFELRKDNSGNYTMNKIKIDTLIEDY